MKKKKERPSDAFRKLVSAAVGDYMQLLPANHYKAGIVYAFEDVHKDKDYNGNHLNATIEGKAAVDRRYLTFTLTIYPQVWNKLLDKVYDNEDVCAIVAHEVAHIATQFLYDLTTATYKDEGEMTDAWESCTTLIGRLLTRLESAERRLRNK